MIKDIIRNKKEQFKFWIALFILMQKPFDVNLSLSFRNS